MRLELLERSESAAGRSGPVDLWHLCADEFKLEAGAGGRLGENGRSEDRRGDGRRESPRKKTLGSIFDDKTSKRRVTGPIDYAIDGKDETAWGIDIGPGRSNVPRKAVFVLEKPISFAGGTMLKFKLNQNHGGWNSDDNQNNNLGRFRFSVTAAAETPKADPLPAGGPAGHGNAARAALAGADGDAVQLLADDRARNGRKRTSKIEELWKQHPQGTSQLAMQSRDEQRQTFVLARGDFLKPTKAIQPGVPALLHPLTAENPTRLDFARWLVDRRVADRRSVDRQSRLADVFRYGAGCHERGFRSARRGAVASRIARLAGG